MIGEALGFLAAAALMALVAWYSDKTGSLTHAKMPGLGSGRTTREKHPLIFWLGNTPWIGGAILLIVLAVMSVTDTLGLTAVFDGVATR